MRLALRKFGIGYKDIKAVTIGGATTRVASVYERAGGLHHVDEPGKIQGEKAGMKLIIEMARLKIPFQFTCTVTTRELIRKCPQIVEKMVTSVAEAYLKLRMGGTEIFGRLDLALEIVNRSFGDS